MIHDFLDDLFGDQEGIVYAPIKGDRWEQHFFEWPAQREQLERHLSDFQSREVYISPALFWEARIAPDTFKGTRCLWTEFDGSVPDGRQDIISPSVRVSSSGPGHEHWYWKLDKFVTDRVIVEDLTRRIAYAYGADLSVWDYQNVLRPIDTWNHKRNRPVTLLSRTDQKYSIETFLHVPIPPAGSRVDISLGSLPSRDTILAKYRWSPDAIDLFSKIIEKGKRDEALMRVAYEAIEAGCSNEEVYVIVEERDLAWGKFVGRTDRHKQLEHIVAKARTKKVFKAEITHGTPEVYRFHDFMQTNIKLEWAVEGILPVAGSMVIFGRPGIGKTTLSLRLAIEMALGRDRFLLWRIPKPQRILFLSLEMQHYEVKEFFENMELTEEEQLALQDQFYIWPIGTAYPLDTPDEQRQLLKYIKLHQIDHIIIDSLGQSMYGSINKDDDMKRLNSFLNEDVRRDNKCGYILIHHPRKRTGLETKDETDQDDVFGSRYITTNAQTILVLTQKPGSTKMHVKFLKRRFTEGPDGFDIERTSNRGFQIMGQLNSVNRDTRGETSDKKRSNTPLGKLLDL